VRRLLLVSNSQAHRVTRYQRDVIARALAGEFKVEESETSRPGHAIDIAREASADGFEVVAALGGDGTVNEVANGLAGTDAALAVIPAGLVNVFARSLGIPNDPVEATGWLLENAQATPRRIPLGRVDGRSFVVNCGVGFDAAIVREVERRQRAKKRGGEWFVVRTGARVFFRGFDRRTPHVRMSWGPGGEQSQDGLFLAIIQNTSPYTFLGNREMRLCPDASVEDGLDAIALDNLRTTVAVRVVFSAFGSGRHVRRRHVVYAKGQSRFDIRCDRPMPVQADGEFIGEYTNLTIESIPGALNVLC
jgi:YegS/Rv2252/BmrU family lipid kinase